MNTSRRPLLRKTTCLAVVGILISALGGCTGRGGGRLPADGPEFTGPASFGFTFSCERSSHSTNPNAPVGQLRLHLSYADHGGNPLGSRFSIQGVADQLDPVLESAICIGEEPPPGGNELIFLGRYRLTTPAPTGFPSTCQTPETLATTWCRFEVMVRDNDQENRRSADFFSIKLSTVTDGNMSKFPSETIIYERSGVLQGGNITVN